MSRPWRAHRDRPSPPGRQQANGFEVIKSRFNKKYLESNFIKTVEELKTNLDSHRLENFTGIMLQYHTLQSTKFMSKWIEEKNK